VVKSNRVCDRLFKTRRVSISPQKQEARGANVNTQNDPFPEQRGFSTQDILWAVGVWSVILSLSPVVVFYVLMVN
jgi:hypothetical protein